MKCKIAALRRVSTFPFVPAPLRPGKAIAAARAPHALLRILVQPVSAVRVGN
jgi:hypothetical protein